MHATSFSKDGRDLYISKWGNYGIGIKMFYFYIGEVYIVEIDKKVRVGSTLHVKYMYT